MLYETSESHFEPAVLEITAGRPRGPRISRRLFGKFSEHLGANVYHGMWAQILDNPGFADAGKFHTEALHQRLAEVERRWQVSGLTAALAAGLAPYWLPAGNEARYALDPGAVRSGRSQRITHRRDSGSCGIEQLIFLPLHRVEEYEITFYARTQGVSGLQISLRRGDAVAAAARIAFSSPDWRHGHIRLRVPPDGHRVGQPYRFRVEFTGRGTVWFDQMLLFPADHVGGFDPDVVRLWKQARLPLLRFPGGNFVSGYHWLDGVGPVEARPTRPNPAWPTVEYNHVGTDEMMRFCQAVGAEPMICVNAGNGSPEEAAAWVQYCNGDRTTEFGALRAKNGRPAPYGVRFWEIGNELYGDWQIGHCDAATYAARYAEFARAMLAADPGILLIANGHTPEWNAELVRRAPARLRAFSVHTLVGGAVPAGADAEAVYRALMAYTHAYPSVLSARLAPARSAGIAAKLAITELQVFTKRSGLPTNATLAEALWTASILNTGIRAAGEVELITHSALINHGGGLRKECEYVWPQPVYFTHALYAGQSGVWPLAVRYSGAFMDAPSVPGIPCPSRVPGLDAVALADEFQREINLLVVNRYPHRPLPARLIFQRFVPAETVSVRTLTGADFLAENTLENPGAVRLEETQIKLPPNGSVFSFPPHSLTLLVFQRAGNAPPPDRGAA